MDITSYETALSFKKTSRLRLWASRRSRLTSLAGALFGLNVVAENSFSMLYDLTAFWGQVCNNPKDEK